MRRFSMSTTPVADKIRTVITQALNPTKLEIHNDSHKHSHHQAMRGASNVTESHFRLEIVSSQFAGKTLPQRHRMVYNLLGEDLQRENGVHALQLKTKTPEEVAK